MNKELKEGRVSFKDGKYFLSTPIGVFTIEAPKEMVSDGALVNVRANKEDPWMFLLTIQPSSVTKLKE